MLRQRKWDGIIEYPNFPLREGEVDAVGTEVLLARIEHGLDLGDGAADGRLYLRSYGQLDTAAASALKASNFGVFFDGSASATLPMTLKVSDQLGQLAMEQIDGFINPLPLGKMEIAWRNLGDSFAKMGGKGGIALLDSDE